LKERNTVIKEFQNNSIFREKVQIILYKLGHTKHNINSILFEKLEHNNKLQIISNLLVAPVLINIVLAITLRSTSFLLLIIINFFINMYFHHKMESVISERASSASYIGMVVNTGFKLSKIENGALSNYTAKIESLYSKCKKIGDSSAFIGRLKGLDSIADYFFILFLIEERNYFKILSQIENNKNALNQIFNLVGEIDSLQAIASYREEINDYVEPIFVAESPFISGIDLKHPLIDTAIPNPVFLKQEGMLITGSNMSGKSTYLRTVALNALFSQTIYTCIAKEYKACFYNIVTSIDPEDNILEGKSYYLGEAQSILRIVKACESDIPVLSMIDEIFRGTNPVERISAAEEILQFLNDSNATILAATHDIELTETLKNYKNYYFREHISENKLEFDYTLKEGVSPTRNAIRILKYLGYPKHITDKIDKKIDIIAQKKSSF
jgi:DNA mismatch repair ATPase MutS